MAYLDDAIFEALQRFAQAVSDKMQGVAAGQPEDQLRGPLETFLADVGKAISRPVVAKGESPLPDRLGRPDYAVLVEKLLAGYIELKEPGKGANPKRFKGHDGRQWKRFQSLPNLIYCDGNAWGLYRDGERVGRIVRLSGDVATDGKEAVGREDAEKLTSLLTNFLSWEPKVPAKAKDLAELLAPLCRMLRQDVADALEDTESPLHQVAADWRELLFPDADNDQFADAYAQTVTFALLLARSENAHTLELNEPIQTLSAAHTLLSRALEALTQPKAQDEIAPSLRLLQRVIDRVPSEAMSGNGETDPWLYFYEDFLAAYDRQLRKDAGAYYTPVEVVHAQVRLVEHLLADRLDKPRGFTDEGVVTLDPAAGTGTYLLGVIEHALDRVADEEGEGAVSGRATNLAENLFGFEIMAGPYAVAELRVSRAFLDHGASLPDEGAGVYLTDTLESPYTVPEQLGFWYAPIAKEHERALRVKDKVPVLVCIGNPPYDRHEAADAEDAGSRARTGGWVRWGEQNDTTGAIFSDFRQPAIDAGHGGDVKNLYNLYVYFYRWALWKVFEHSTASGPGVVSYISASSYFDGDAFVGMREYMRRLCDEIWLIDLGGEGRGTRREENVFAIQTPVAIAVAVCYGRPDRETPATVLYTRIEGSHDEKLRHLENIRDFDDLTWEECPTDWQAPFRPAGKGTYFDWPLLTDLMPWQNSGVQVKRTWPAAPEQNTLKRRWQALLKANDRKRAFKETRDRNITNSPRPLTPARERGKKLADLSQSAPVPVIEPYGYRSFDRQWILADNRLGDFMRPQFWIAQNDRQVYLTTLLNHPLGSGPAATACAHVPDLHHFRGSYGAKEAFPLYRDAGAETANMVPGLLDLLRETLGESVSETDLFAYI